MEDTHASEGAWFDRLDRIPHPGMHVLEENAAEDPGTLRLTAPGLPADRGCCACGVVIRPAHGVDESQSGLGGVHVELFMCRPVQEVAKGRVDESWRQSLQGNDAS